MASASISGQENATQARMAHARQYRHDPKTMADVRSAHVAAVARALDYEPMPPLGPAPYDVSCPSPSAAMAFATTAMLKRG